jgi:hypothetical protein
MIEQVGRCDCCRIINVLTPNGFCYTCDAVIDRDYRQIQALQQRAEQEDDAEMPHFD